MRSYYQHAAVMFCTDEKALCHILHYMIHEVTHCISPEGKDIYLLQSSLYKDKNRSKSIKRTLTKKN